MGREISPVARLPQHPFIECGFCGKIFDKHSHRYCPDCIEKAENLKEFIYEQRKQQEQDETITKIEQFLDKAALPNDIKFPAEEVEPLYEVAVRELFAQRAEKLGYKILKSGIGFPDYILEHKKGVIRAEAELLASNFKKHKHDINGCDLIVCWKNDWKDCPIGVLSLKDLSFIN